jgi:diguanylate cyclase (GGDEF)-like protein
LRLGAGAPAVPPRIAHQETPLADLPAVSTNDRIFVTDDAGQVVGLVAGHEVQERLQAGNERERDRWGRMPLAALVQLRLPPESLGHAPRSQAVTDCAVLEESGRLTGILTDDDVYLSWKRIHAIVSGTLKDPLTELTNRLGYERRLHEEWDRAGRLGYSVGLMIIDLDHFKEINDQHGHSFGDTVLRQVARLLESSLRSYDIVARYGGDEFVVLCLGCGRTEIAIPLRRILRNLADAEVRAGGRSTRLSASIGTAVRHSNFQGSSAEELFAAADQCLYIAKQTRGAAVGIELGVEVEQEPEPIQIGPGPGPDNGAEMSPWAVRVPN